MHEEAATLAQAARHLAEADALLIGAGAGMGVDSGLPDFRGTEGFWKAYPPLAKRGLRFEEMANPHWFRDDPALAWGFYGHRLHLYRNAAPHPGFEILRRWAARMPLGAFVYTSNVDGHFQRAGFSPENVYEVHGSLNHLQCLATRPCGQGVWPADETEVAVNPDTLQASAPLPACPACGALARPNVLMFGDYLWNSRRTAEQRERFLAWFDRTQDHRLLVIEIGAGSAVPTVRHACEEAAAQPGTTLLRINPRDPQVPADLNALSLPLGGLEAVTKVNAVLTHNP